MEQIVSKYLGLLNIPISKKYCEKLIVSHPDYPSLLSISDALERLGIRYKAARIEKEHLNNLEYPYLFWLDEHNRELRIVRDQRDLPTNGAQSLGHNGSGKQAIVLKAEPTDTIADEENNRQRSQDHFLKILTAGLVVAIAGLILLAAVPLFSWMYTLLLLASLAGTIVGYLLIAKDVGINYKPVEAFCRAGKKTNCDTVLNSEAARLFGDKVTFSDATVCYFLFQLLVIGFLIPGGEGTSFLWILYVLSGLAVPIVLYSLYYQYAKVRIWCRLCLLVDAVLVLQVALFGYMYYGGIITTPDVILQPLVQVGLLFAATGSFILMLKTKLKTVNKSMKAEIAANRIKNSPEIFMHLLSREKRVDTTPFEQELLIGNPEAPVKILMAASLVCYPCKTGFEKAVQLVATYLHRVNLTIRLRTDSENNGDITPVTALLGYWQQHIQGKVDMPARTEELFRDWYRWVNLEEFRKKYPVERSGMIDTAKLRDKYFEWFRAGGIKGTPTFFINGWRLPRQYGIGDLAGVVPALANNFIKGDAEELVSVPDQNKNKGF